MDGIHTVAETARELGVSSQRVLRAAARLRLDLVSTGSSRRATTIVTESQRRALVRALGSVPPGAPLPRTQLLALAALACAPRGVVSARALARRVGASPTTMTRAIADLERAGLLVRRPERVAMGRVTDIDMLHVDRETDEWRAVADIVTRIRLPNVEPQRSSRVPNELLHVFWNTHWSQLQLGDAGDYVARRLTSTNDLDALAWGATHVAAASWTHAARTRGLTRRRRRLAENLAREAAA